MKRVLLGVLALVAFACAPASAKPLNGGVTPAEVVAVLAAAGVATEQSTDKDGDPQLKGTVESIIFFVRFYDCKAGRCIATQFSAGFDFKEGKPLDLINSWNRTHRFGRAWLDDENDPYVQMDHDWERGGTTEAIANDFEIWRTLMREFPKYIGYTPAN